MRLAPCARGGTLTDPWLRYPPLRPPPVYRDILLHLGLCSVSKRACSTILRRGSLGTAIVIVIGGATESLRAHPGTNDLTLKRRMGFIKIAIREGCVSVSFASPSRAATLTEGLPPPPT